MRVLLVVAVLTLVLRLAGCISPTYPISQYGPLEISSVAVGMTEGEVRDLLGPPADVVGSMQYTQGHVVTVLQYLEVEFSYSSDQDRLTKDYYLYFLDNRLLQWGRPGDWQREADQIIEFRYFTFVAH